MLGALRRDSRLTASGPANPEFPRVLRPFAVSYRLATREGPSVSGTLARAALECKSDGEWVTVEKAVVALGLREDRIARQALYDLAVERGLPGQALAGVLDALGRGRISEDQLAQVLAHRESPNPLARILVSLIATEATGDLVFLRSFLDEASFASVLNRENQVDKTPWRDMIFGDGWIASKVNTWTGLNSSGYRHDAFSVAYKLMPYLRWNKEKGLYSDSSGSDFGRGLAFRGLAKEHEAIELLRHAQQKLDIEEIRRILQGEGLGGGSFLLGSCLADIMLGQRLWGRNGAEKDKRDLTALAGRAANIGPPAKNPLLRVVLWGREPQSRICLEALGTIVGMEAVKSELERRQLMEMDPFLKQRLGQACKEAGLHLRETENGRQKR